MLSSGNGRHRRPRQAPAAMVTVAATGAGLALPLLGAGVAQAADAGTWDKVAVCETGGLWSADTHNGFYGGLAITQDTWDAYGGRKYAKRPDLASRSQQIAVAEKILADIGPQAWPGCETATGLTQDAAPPDVNPGDAVTPAPEATTPAADPGGTVTPGPEATTPASGTGTGTGNGTGTGTGTGPGDPSAPSTDPGATPADPTAPSAPPAADLPTLPNAPGAGAPWAPGTGPSTDPGTDPGTSPATPGDPSSAPAAPGTATPSTPAAGRHAKPYSPTDEELAAADRATRTHAYSVTGTDDGAADGGSGNGGDNHDGADGADGADGGDKSAGGANSSDKSGTSTTSGNDAYTVGEGDSLSGIASAHDVDGGWLGLYDANQHVIGEDPNLIKPGQILNIG